MAGDPARTLLVLSQRPHPWAALRDRLDAAMVRVTWLRPGAPRPPAPPWAIAGEGPAIGQGWPWPALAWWVGEAPAGDLVPRVCASWREIGDQVLTALGVSVGGVRLAPICGLARADGTYLQGLGRVETLLAAGPDGLPVPPTDAPFRRLRAAVRSHGLPLIVREEDGVVRLLAIEEPV
jgi:hypothetical protein